MSGLSNTEVLWKDESEEVSMFGDLTPSRTNRLLHRALPLMIAGLLVYVGLDLLEEYVRRHGFVVKVKVGGQ